MKGIRRVHGASQWAAAPLLTQDLQRIAHSMGTTLSDARDLAVLLVGFAGAFRRSELIALDRKHVEFERGGMMLNIGRAKTDADGRGRKVFVPPATQLQVCPVAALRRWLEAAQIESGPIFCSIAQNADSRRRLSGEAVAAIVKRRVAQIGLDADRYSGHSLRAGFVTCAVFQGRSALEIMARTGHATERMVARYARWAPSMVTSLL